MPCLGGATARPRCPARRRSLAFGLFGLPSAINGLALALGVVALLLNIAVVVLLALRPSNEFFAAHSARRR